MVKIQKFDNTRVGEGVEKERPMQLLEISVTPYGGCEHYHTTCLWRGNSTPRHLFYEYTSTNAKRQVHNII